MSSNEASRTELWVVHNIIENEAVYMYAGGGGYLLISVAELRYRHASLVRLCHKFYFCPFQMKILHIDEEKSCMRYLSRALSRIF